MAYLPVNLPSVHKLISCLIGHVHVRVCWRRGSIRKWQIFSGCVFSNSSTLELVSPKLPTPPLSHVWNLCNIYKLQFAMCIYTLRTLAYALKHQHDGWKPCLPICLIIRCLKILSFTMIITLHGLNQNRRHIKNVFLRQYSQSQILKQKLNLLTVRWSFLYRPHAFSYVLSMCNPISFNIICKTR